MSEKDVRNRKVVAYRPIQKNLEFVDQISARLNISRNAAVDLLVSLSRERIGSGEVSIESRIVLKDQPHDS